MIHRRRFLTQSTGALGAAVFSRWIDTAGALGERIESELARHASERLAEDEAFWAEIRRTFTLDPRVINLDHGWTNPAPLAAMDDLVEGARELQALPAERIAKIWPEVITTHVRKALAEALAVPGDQIAIVRNATEALDTVLLGVPLERGDEIVCSAHDYYAMLDALEQRQARDGVVIRMIRPPVPAHSLDELAELYENAIGPRTKLVLLTHPSNLTGQLLPVQRIAETAHRVGAEVVIDGAQSLGLLEGSIADLGCDYYGASLHKWIGAPIGMGVLWMRPEHTAKVWPLIPSPGVQGIGRYEWIGTAPDYVCPAALPALALQRTLGASRKAERLRYLASYWRQKLEHAIPEVRFYSLLDPAMSVGLTTVEFPRHDPRKIQQRLREEHHILVQAMGNARAPEIRGIRVTPNVYTTPYELDLLIEALAAIAAG